MSRTERDATRIVESWLEEGVTALPDRVLDAVMSDLPTTHQRRAGWLARRFPIMNNTVIRYGLAAAVVVLALLVGTQFLPTSNTGWPNATPTPSPTPTQALPNADSRVALAPGTYASGQFQVPITATVPAGWQGNVGGPYFVALSPGSVQGGLFFLIFDQVAADPCDASQGMVDVPGATADDLVTAFSEMPGIDVSDVAAVTIEGYSGTRFSIQAQDNFAGCNLAPEGYVLWELPLGARFSLGSGGQGQLWVLDVGGDRLVIYLDETGFTEAQRTEAQAVFDSIRIGSGS